MKFFNLFLDFIKQHDLFSVYICISILLGAIYFILFNTKLHEYCHILAMYLNKIKTPEFKDKLRPNIETEKLKANTTSNFTDFLATNPVKYSKQIKSIARAGTLYPCILFAIFSVFSFLAVQVCIFFLFPFIFFVLTIILSVFSYFINCKEKKDKNGNIISQPDRFLVKHPEQFKNIHKK